MKPYILGTKAKGKKGTNDQKKKKKGKRKKRKTRSAQNQIQSRSNLVQGRTGKRRKVQLHILESFNPSKVRRVQGVNKLRVDPIESTPR